MDCSIHKRSANATAHKPDSKGRRAAMAGSPGGDESVSIICESKEKIYFNSTNYRSLASMRVDPGLHLKNLDSSSNALLAKRKKAKGDNGGESSMSFLTKF